MSTIMKFMLKRICLSLLLTLLLATPALAQSRAAQVNTIATIDLRKVFENYWKRQQAEAALKDRGASLDKELKGFTKVALEPLERKIVRIDLDARAFAFYDPAKRDWVVEPGAYDLLIGGSAADIELQATVRLEAAD